MISINWEISKAILNNFLWKQERKLRELIDVHLGGLRRSNFVFLFCPNTIADSQIYPFYYFEKQLSRLLNFKPARVNLYNAHKHIREIVPGVNTVCVQSWLNYDTGLCDELFDHLKIHFPNAKFIFMDWYAPTDIRMARNTNKHIDFYVKKNLLKNLQDYGNPTLGDTNLEDYYGNLFNLPREEVIWDVPDGFLSKIIAGPGFITGPYLQSLFNGSLPNPEIERPIDLNARLETKGSDWYTAMRKASIDSVLKLPDNIIIAHGDRLTFKQYLAELSQAKITFSPFGYGEVCWRDFEAIAMGSLLIKPEMEHMVTEPNMYLPYETYIPVKWDFTDLEEKVVHYLNNENERIKITENAYRLAQDYYNKSQFVEFVDSLINSTEVALLSE